MPGNYSNYAKDDIYLFGRFSSLYVTDSISQPNEVTIQLCLFPGNILVPLLSNVVTETAIPGYWHWSTAQINPSLVIPSYPEPVTMLYVMRDLYGCEYSGKFTLNQMAEDARRAYLTAQALL